MSDIQSQINARIQSFVAELNGLVRQAALDAVSSVLGGSASAPAKRGPGRPRKVPAALTVSAPAAGSSAPAKRGPGRPPGRARKGGKRSPELLARTVEDLAKHIAGHPGERIEQISKHMRVATADLALPIIKLLNGKRITKKGVKRSTKYFPH